MLLGEFVDETRGQARLPEAVDAPVGGKIELQPLAGAGQADMGEPAFLLQPGTAALVEGALVGKQSFLPAGQEDGVELQPLGGVQRHDRDAGAGFAAIGVHDQRDMLEEGR